MAPEGAWFKSTHSGAEGNSCVEVANLDDIIGIRDSKDKSGPALVVPADAWSSFIDFVRSGNGGHGLGMV
ncbi:DUF397 domain-containing protein [Streptomyces sp. CA-111067]|uniref:DUF397 domain-containing protein n=1 Tax=Streptomyces sp. CA-111067 TaxID=3240046 RepID=UPI003D96B936